MLRYIEMARMENRNWDRDGKGALASATGFDFSHEVIIRHLEGTEEG